jgi:very-short-patch-repair endonuclease
MTKDPEDPIDHRARGLQQARDPEWRRKQLAGVARRNADPEYQRKTRTAQALVVPSPDWLRRMREGCARRSADPEYLQKMRALGARHSADPDWKGKISQARSLQSADPEYRQHHRDGVRRATSTPEWQRENRQRLAQLHADPEVQRKIRESWNDPEVQNRRVRCQNPSRYEIALREFLPDTFLHTGQDVTRRVLGKFPDYQDPEQRLIVEMDGHWRHRTPKGQAQNVERDRLLADAGWRVLHIAPQELRRPDDLRSRIVAFMGGQTS